MEVVVSGTATLDVLQNIIREIFDEASIEVTMETTAEEVEGWDSLTHIQVITAIETHFGFKLKLAEVMRFENVGDICSCIETRTTG